MPEPLPLTHDTVKVSHSADDQPIEVPPVVEEAAVLNDEVILELAPDRPAGTIRVRLAFTGRSTPIQADNPWAE